MWEAMEKTREYGFGQEVKRRIMLGTYALSSGYYDAYYKQAEKVRSLITQDFDRAFERFDVLVSPTTPSVAFKLGEISDPYQMYLQDVFTLPPNLAGICGISIPGGFSDGLPVGLQLLGNIYAEDVILRVADAFERVTDYHTRWPKALPEGPDETSSDRFDGDCASSLPGNTGTSACFHSGGGTSAQWIDAGYPYGDATSTNAYCDTTADAYFDCRGETSHGQRHCCLFARRR